MKKKLFIFSNESISSQDGKFFCDNIDLKTTPEGLNKEFEVNLFGRKSKISRSHEIKIKKIKIYNNIFSYIFSAIEAAKMADAKYLVISIIHRRNWLDTWISDKFPNLQNYATSFLQFHHHNDTYFYIFDAI